MNVSNGIKIIDAEKSTSIPNGYYTLGKILTGGDFRFQSLNAAIDACIQLSDFFRQLHEKEFCFSDMSDDNFLFHTQTGDLIVYNKGNIIRSGTVPKVWQKPRYAAPEMVTEEKTVAPSVQSERYSLSVLIFIILFGGHPLEGKRILIPTISYETSKNIYGRDPVFIFDLQNDSNRPDPIIHSRVIKRWQILPPYAKNLCLRAFSKAALSDSSLQPLENEWLDMLWHLKKDLSNTQKK